MIHRHYCPNPKCGWVYTHTPTGGDKKGMRNKFYCRFCHQLMGTRRPK